MKLADMGLRSAHGLLFVKSSRQMLSLSPPVIPGSRSGVTTSDRKSMKVFITFNKASTSLSSPLRNFSQAA